MFNDYSYHVQSSNLITSFCSLVPQAQAKPVEPVSRKQRAKEKVLRSKALGDASRVQPVVW